MEEMVTYATWAWVLIILGLGVLIFLPLLTKRKVSKLNSFRIFIVFIFLAVFTICLPVSSDYGFYGIPNGLHTAMGVFALETGMSDFMNDLDFDLTKAPSVQYVIWVLFLAAPILTGAFFLSFFRSFCARVRLLFCVRRDMYFFSDLNRNTVNLAKSIMYGHKWTRRIVFFGVDKQELEDSPFIKDLEEIDAILVPRMISREKLWLCQRWRCYYWICASDDEERNISDALKLEKRIYVGASRNKEAVIYVFASNAESELHFASESTSKKQEESGKKKFLRHAEIGTDVRVMRKDPARSLAWNYMYMKASNIIHVPDDVGSHAGINYVHAVIVGLTKESKELFHMLPWLLQFNGWNLNLHVFDSDPLAEERLKAECPELLDDRYNHASSPDEASYDIYIHSGVDYDTYDFHEKLMEINSSSDSIGPITYVFVSTGKDDENIKVSMDIRNLLGYRRNSHNIDVPYITTVINDLDDRNDVDSLKHTRKYKGFADWHIDFLSYVDVWCERLLKGSEMEELGLEVNRIYSKTTEAESDAMFWRYEYSYMASLATALSMRLHRSLLLPVLAEEEMARYEHRRWLVYMRSSGWKLAKNPEKAEEGQNKNEAATCIKGHDKMKNWSEMTDEQRQNEIKDYRAISKLFYNTPMNRSVYAFLWNHGKEIFERAKPSVPDGDRIIKALIVNYSHYSVEVFKALVWYCQVEGYFLELTFKHEAKDHIAKSLSDWCPEILDGHNGNRDSNEARYRIAFTTRDLEESERGDVTFVFSSRNWNMEHESGDEALRRMNDIKRMYGNAMVLVDFDPVDVPEDVFTLYSSELADDAVEMEKAGLKRHLIWGDEPYSFWNDAYNYESSISSAMHIKLRKELGISGADKAPEDRTASERECIERMEHARWCAWLRTEGWRFASERDNAQKKHNLLIPFDNLDEGERVKDNV